MRTYIRGDRLAPKIQTHLSKAELKKYWFVDEQGNPVGKPFLRRSEIELYEATIAGEYQIISGKVGRPPSGESDREIKARHDRKRQSDPERKAEKARYARERRRRQRDRVNNLEIRY